MHLTVTRMTNDLDGFDAVVQVIGGRPTQFVVVTCRRGKNSESGLSGAHVGPAADDPAPFKRGLPRYPSVRPEGSLRSLQRCRCHSGVYGVLQPCLQLDAREPATCWIGTWLGCVHDGRPGSL
jgi:hypothetical protein